LIDYYEKEYERKRFGCERIVRGMVWGLLEEEE